MTFKQGHEVRARIQRPGDPGTAHETFAHDYSVVNESPPEDSQQIVLDVANIARDLKVAEVAARRMERDKVDLMYSCPRRLLRRR